MSGGSEPPDRSRETPQGQRMLLGAFRGGNPLERIVAVPSLWPRPGGVLQHHGLGVHRPSEANTFVNTCRLPVTNRGSQASDHSMRPTMPTGIMFADNNGELLRAGRQRTTLSIERRGLACAVHFG